MHLGSWESTQEAREHLASPRAIQTLVLCPPSFPHASITQKTHAKHGPFLNFRLLDGFLDCLYYAIVHMAHSFEEDNERISKPVFN